MVVNICLQIFKSLGPFVQLLECAVTEGRTHTQTGPRTLPLPLMLEVKINFPGVVFYVSSS